MNVSKGAKPQNKVSVTVKVSPEGLKAVDQVAWEHFVSRSTMVRVLLSVGMMHLDEVKKSIFKIRGIE